MPLYVADYLADTQHLSTIEHGAYDLLIMHYWRHGGLPPDDDKLRAITKMTKPEWRRHRATLAAFFTDWKHKRIDYEIEKANDKHERRQSAGKRGGIASANAKQNSSNAGSIAQASSSQPESEREDTAGAVSSSEVKSGKYAFSDGIIRLTREDFDKWQAAFSHLHLSAELMGLSKWADEQGPRWFHAVKGALAKKNREAAERAAKSKSEPEFKYNGGMEGIV